MKDDLYASPSQTQHLPATAPDAAPPVALEYQPPQPRRPRGSDMGWGMLISFFLAMGVGWFMFGVLVMSGQRDDHAGPIAVGAAFMVLAAGIAGALAWTRRQQQQQQQHSQQR